MGRAFFVWGSADQRPRPVLAVVLNGWGGQPEAPQRAGVRELEPDDVHQVGLLLFGNYNLPFQIIGVLILVATIGVIVLSKRELH